MTYWRAAPLPPIMEQRLDRKEGCALLIVIISLMALTGSLGLIYALLSAH